MAPIQVNSIKGKVREKTEPSAIPATPVMDYTPMLSMARAHEDDANLVKHDRAHYVAVFKQGVEKTACAKLAFYRTVYEASRVLDSYKYADQLPSAWTTIYQITQITSDSFECFLKEVVRLSSRKCKRHKW